MTFDLSAARWLNPPTEFNLTADSLRLTTDPATDFWQRSYYGFRNDNGHALLLESDRNFTFSVHASFAYTTQFDQCGIMVYLDSGNWCKASLEYENEAFSRLGSVVTNHGHSDWATTDIALVDILWYRLSRRGPDFLIESALDGQQYQQMRIFHLHALGETTPEMGQADPPLPPVQPVSFGLYACSPLEGSFTAQFDNFILEDCRWHAHQ